MEQYESRQLLAPVTQLIADLDGTSTGSTNPSAFQDAGGGQTNFRAATFPSSIWRTDGTALGTVQLATGLDGDLETVGNLVFYVHNDGVHGAELWRTDGTTAGTILLQDIYPGQVGSTPVDLTNFNGSLMFVAKSSGALWRSDGTVAGTVPVKSVSGLGYSQFGHHLTNVNGTLFFHPDSTPYYASEGTELWKSDGTAAGTVLIKNFAGTGNTFSSSDGDDFFNFDGKLLFRTDTGSTGYNLWISDGSDAGTTLLKGFGGGYSNKPQYWQEVNGIVYFGAESGLWRTDGTSAGTVLVSSVKPYGASGMANVNGTLFFNGDDGVHGPELWKSDGTAAGTVMVKDVNKVYCCVGPSGFVNWNGTLLFVGNDGVHGDEPWISDGTDAGTQMMADINPGSASGVTGTPALVNGTVFFSGQDPAHGSELWKIVDVPQPAAANVPPSGADGAVRAVESAAYAFQVSDFGFSDAADNSPDHFQAVKINTLPGGGTLTNNNTAVTAGQFIPAFDIAQGRLRYAPTAGKTGSTYASFTFQVQDDGGTAAGGNDLATIANTITINVPPALKVLEDVPYAFVPMDFGLTGVSPPDSVTSITIASLPAAGSLSLSGEAITAGQTIAMSDVVAGNLSYLAAANANGNAYARFTYQQTGGGQMNTIDINVTPVNDPPTGASATLTTDENTPYYIKNYELGFSDANDKATSYSTGQSYFANVIITSITGRGQLGYRFGTITNQSQLPVTISVQDFDYYTRFVPDPNTNGTACAQIGFKLQDGGGTAFGGLDTDLIERTLTINVNSVNAPPRGANKTIATPEDAAYTLASDDFGFTDPSDTPANAFKAVKIVTQPTKGYLRYSGAGLPSELISAADIAAGKLQYIPPANANGLAFDGFTFRVEDDGGLMRAGRDMDGVARTMTFNVTPANDAPAGTSRTISLIQNTAYVLGIADFGFSDPADMPPTSSILPDRLSAVIITAVPANGSLTDDNVLVSAGQVIPVSDIVGRKLRFTPAPDAIGSAYDSLGFEVKDTGGTALFGIDVDPLAKTLTWNVVLPGANQEPSGSDATFEILEDTAYTFGRGDFGFRDASQTPANNFAGVKITTRPALGVVVHDGLPAAAGEFVSVADIDAGKLKFVPAGNGNGLAYTNFTFQVQDDGGTANGGSDLDSTRNTISIRVDAVSDAPSGKNTTVDYYPSYSVRIADFGFSDLADDPAVNKFVAVKITTLPTAGSLMNSGVAVTAGQFIPVSDITAGGLQYKYSGSSNYYTPFASFTFQVQDDGGTALGGADLDPTPKTISFQTYVVCDCPISSIPTFQFPENRTSELTLDSFWYYGNHSPVSLRISTQSYHYNYYGSFSVRYNNQSIDPYFGGNVPISDIIAGKLTVTAPAAGTYGTSSYLMYQVVYDDNYVDTTQTISLYAKPVNDPPRSADKAIGLPASGTYAFGLGDFAFSDAEGDKLQSIKVETLPESGVLSLDGNVVAAGQLIDPASIAAGKLTFSHDQNGTAGQPLARFNFRVKDDGGTADGGRDTDYFARTISFMATAVNNPPQGTDKTAYAVEDTPYTLQAADFGFTDPLNTPPNNFLAVTISSLPGKGTLTFSGAPVAVGQVISVTSFSTLVFVPAANGNGAVYDSFTFQVQDDAAQISGGSDLDLTPNTLTFAVSSINDAPSGYSRSLTLPPASISAAYTFGLADFGYVDANDSPPNGFSYVRVTPSNVLAGSLLLNGTKQTWETYVYATDITAGRLQYRLPATTPAVPDSFTFRVVDNGGTYNGGVDTDPTAKTLTLNIVAGVNHAPVGSDHTVTGALEDTTYTFGLADFSFNDNDGNTQSLVAVKIATLPAVGSFTLAYTPVTVGRFIPASDIANGNLRFLPSANGNGAAYASFAFQVQDSGGTATLHGEQGVDLDLTARVMTINVTSINDPPTGFDRAMATVPGTTYVFSPSDFPIDDSRDVPGNTLAAVRITTLPSSRSLLLNGVPVTAGQFVSVVDLNAGMFQLIAPSGIICGPSGAFTFQVQDNGGTVNSGFDLDPAPKTITFDSALGISTNHPPTGVDGTISTLEDTQYAFRVGDFRFVDGDIPPNNLWSVKVSSLPAVGVLFDNGTEVVAGEFISLANVSFGEFAFQPPVDAFGVPLTSFTFQVQDDGGTGGCGSSDLDPTPRTMTLKVAPVNDSPIFRAGPDQSVLDTNGPQGVAGWARDISFGPMNEVGQKVHFVLTNDNPSLFAIQPAVDATGNLTFQPAVGANAVATVTVVAIDDGGTANGGFDTSQQQTFTIGVSLAKPLHNRAIAADVTGDTKVVAEDVIDVINFINASGSGPVAPAKPGEPRPAFYYDVTGDDYIAADDVVTIINYINAHPTVQQEAGAQSATDMAETNEALFTLLAADTAAQSKRRRA